MRSLCVATRERLHIATETQHSQKEIIFKNVYCMMHYIKVFHIEAFMHLSRVLAVFFL